MARKPKHSAPVMTNSAAIRVLYDLAGGRMKTWPALARDLDINVDDIYKRNRPWPSDFGRLRYREAFETYAEEVHTSRYATLLAVRRSLQDSNAYTDEVKEIVENVRADSNEELIRSCLDRLVDTIIETARPYNEIARLEQAASIEAQADGNMGDAGEHAEAADAAPAAGTAGAGTGATCDAGQAPGESHSDTPLAPAALTPRLLAAFLTGNDLDGIPWYDALADPTATLRRVPPVTAGKRIAPRVPGDTERFLGAIMPPALLARAVDADSLEALMDGQAQPALIDGFVQALCEDSGLGCRTMARSCVALTARIDADAFFGNANYLLQQLEARTARSALPDFSFARRFYLRHGDGDCARALFVLVLLALVGPTGLRRVVECPENGYLFER